MAQRKGAFFFDYPLSEGVVYGEAQRARIAGLVDLYPHVVHGGNFAEHRDGLRDVEVICATWGMPALSAAQFEAMPRLEAVFYAAGNVKVFAPPLLEHGVILVSAWAINAIPTAEMCFAEILLSLRGYFRAVRTYSATKRLDAKAFPRSGVQDETVGLIGTGHIASRVRRKLADYPLQVIAHDPLLDEAKARALDVERVGLEELFERALVVSNHTPDLPSTKGVLHGGLFKRLRPGATFINTGRGAQVVEADLIEMLRARPDVTVLTDVTWPEPPAADSPLWTLPNIVMSPHIGGTVGNEVTRLADGVIDELERWLDGEPLRYQVTPEVFATMG